MDEMILFPQYLVVPQHIEGYDESRKAYGPDLYLRLDHFKFIEYPLKESVSMKIIPRSLEVAVAPDDHPQTLPFD